VCQTVNLFTGIKLCYVHIPHILITTYRSYLMCTYSTEALHQKLCAHTAHIMLIPKLSCVHIQHRHYTKSYVHIPHISCSYQSYRVCAHTAHSHYIISCVHTAHILIPKLLYVHILHIRITPKVMCTYRTHALFQKLCAHNSHTHYSRSDVHIPHTRIIPKVMCT
jgi:hypothetical protein